MSLKIYCGRDRGTTKNADAPVGCATNMQQGTMPALTSVHNFFRCALQQRDTRSLAEYGAQRTDNASLLSRGTRLRPDPQAVGDPARDRALGSDRRERRLLDLLDCCLDLVRGRLPLVARVRHDGRVPPPADTTGQRDRLVRVLVCFGPLGPEGEAGHASANVSDVRDPKLSTMALNPGSSPSTFLRKLPIEIDKL